jgi:benzoyl-CoA reductase subunit C
MDTAAVETARSDLRIVQRCEALFEDLHFNAVKEWKAAAPGRKAIGYMPVYVPRELIHAAGMLPVGILGGGDQLEVIQGDAYYQSYICRIPRSTIELGLTGRLDCLDGMLFPSICDVIRNLSGMWQILFKDKYVRYVDVPQNYQDASAARSTSRRCRCCATTSAACRRADHRRRAERVDRRLQRQPRRDPRPVRLPRRQALAGADLRGLPAAARRHGAAGGGAHALVREYLAAAEKLARPKRDNARVVINGSFCEQPPLALIKSIEMAGCYIVDDDFMLVTRWLLDEVPADGDPLEELSKAFLHRSASTAAKYDATREEKGVFLMKQVKTRGAEGVVFAAPSFCDPALLERPMLQDVLSKHGIPHTAFKYAENTGQMAPIREQAGTFADSIKLWNAA